MFGTSFIALCISYPTITGYYCSDSKLYTNFELIFFHQKNYSTNIQVSKANVKLTQI